MSINSYDVNHVFHNESKLTPKVYTSQWYASQALFDVIYPNINHLINRYKRAQSNTLCTAFQRMSGYVNSRSGKIQNCQNGALDSLTLTYMKEFFTHQSEMSTRNTRYSKVNKLYVPKQNLCVSRRALYRYNGCIEFNKLPSDIQDCKTLASFKCKAFKYIMQSV